MEKAASIIVNPKQHGSRSAPDFLAQMSSAAVLLQQSGGPGLFEDPLETAHSPLLSILQQRLPQSAGAAPSATNHSDDGMERVGQKENSGRAADTVTDAMPEDVTLNAAKTAITSSDLIENGTIPNAVATSCSFGETNASKNCILQSGSQSHLNPTDASCPTEKPLPPERRIYTPEAFHKLRHTRRLSLPAGDPVALSASNSNTLPVLLFKPCETLTADVLLAGDDARAKFSDLQLSPALLSALPSAGFETPSPIQIRTIPRARLGCDVIAHAKSGTGKTAAYAVATLDTQMLGSSVPSSSGRPHTLVLVPTRELAIQTAGVFLAVAAHILPPLSIATLVGGISEQSDITSLATSPPHVVVGTPGRICSLVDSGGLMLHAVSVIVLDEADLLLSRAFHTDVHSIIESLPQAHQTLAFSATFPPWLRRMLMNIMRQPAYITDSDNPNHFGDFSEGVSAVQQAILLGVQQCKVVAQTRDRSQEHHGLQGPSGKADILIRVLQQKAFHLCMVFCNYKKQLGKLEAKIRRAGFACKKMSGDVSQKERNKVMDAVSNGAVRVVVATDLLARGIDIKSCDLVIQFDVPSEVETYLHRVGRAGRFGRQGRSFLLHNGDEERPVVAALESALGYTLQCATIPKLAATNTCSNVVQRGEKQKTECGEGKNFHHEAARIKTHEGSGDSGTHEPAIFSSSHEDVAPDEWSLAVMSAKLVDQTVSKSLGLGTTQPIRNPTEGLAEEPGKPSFTVELDDMDTELCPSFTPEKGKSSLKRTRFEEVNPKESKTNHPFPVHNYYDTPESCEMEESKNNFMKNHHRAKRIKSGNTVSDSGKGLTKLCSSPEVGCEEAVEESWIHLSGGRSKDSDERWETFAKKAWQAGYDDGFQRAFRMASELRSRLNG